MKAGSVKRTLIAAAVLSLTARPLVKAEHFDITLVAAGPDGV